MFLGGFHTLPLSRSSVPQGKEIKGAGDLMAETDKIIVDAENEIR